MKLIFTPLIFTPLIFTPLIFTPLIFTAGIFVMGLGLKVPSLLNAAKRNFARPQGHRNMVQLKRKRRRGAPIPRTPCRAGERVGSRTIGRIGGPPEIGEPQGRSPPFHVGDIGDRHGVRDPRFAGCCKL
ncbi:MAG: hypothetical protein ACI9VS_001758 [Candidatus Binatia bacterium]|jgi:hypothetical protein